MRRTDGLALAAALLGLAGAGRAGAQVWGGEERLTVDATVCETGLNHGALALDSWGRLTAAWAEQDGIRNNFRIHTRTRETSGAWGAQELAVEFHESYVGSGLGAKFPALVTLPGDTLLLVWHDYRVAGIDNLELFTKVRPPGAAWGDSASEVRLTTSDHPDSSADNSYVPSLALDPGGAAHVAWYDYRYDASNAEILFKSRAGGAWDVTPGDAADADVSQNAGDSQFPALAAGPDGSLHLAWRDNTGGSYRILYRHRDPGGAWSGAVFLSPPGVAADGVTLAVDAAGTVVAAWSDFRTGSKAIYVRERSPAGTWGPPVRATPDAAGAEEPALAVGPGGARHLVWQDARVSVFNREVFHQSAWGGAWDSTGAADTRLSNGSGKSSRPSILADAGGGVHVVWQDARHGPTEMYYRALAPVSGVGDAHGVRAPAAYPNPFRDSVRVPLGGRAPAAARVVDLAGRRVCDVAVAGAEVHWDGRDAWGRSVPPGVYWIAFAGGDTPLAPVRVVRRP